MATGNSTYATLATTTLIHFANEIFDAVVTNNACLNQLQKAGNVKVVGGGRQFTHPVFYQSNSTFGAIGKFGTIPTDLQDPLTRAEYDICVIAGSVVYSIVEEAMNAGNKEKLIDYVESLKMVAERSMSEVMGDQVMKAESARGASDFDSIPFLIADNPSAGASQSAVGGVNATSSGGTWWRNATYSSSITAFSVSSDGLEAFDTLLNRCTKGREGPTFGITTATILTLYQLVLAAQVRYTSIDKGDLGFKNLLYATIPIMIDDNTPADHCYFVNGNAFKLQVLAKGNMMMTPGQPAYSQLMVRHLMYFLGNITTGDRRTSGVIASITG